MPLSPEPAPGQRHAVSHGPVRSLSLIFHPCAVWQWLNICLLHSELRAAEQQQPGRRWTGTSLALAAGVSVSELLEQLLQQMPPVAGGDGSDCERAEARGGSRAPEGPEPPCR